MALAHSTPAAAPPAGGAPAPSPLSSLNNEDRAFLEEALKTDVMRMRDHLAVFQSATASLADREAALDEINFHVEAIDNACDLHKIRGLEPMLQTARDAEQPVTLRRAAAWVLATCVQNNPGVQQQFDEISALPVLLALLQSESDAELRLKLLSAVSGYLKGNAAGVDRFAAAGGWPLLRPHVAADHRAAVRVLWMLAQLLHERPALADVLAANDYLPAIAQAALQHASQRDLQEKAIELLLRIAEHGGADTLAAARRADVLSKLQQLDAAWKAASGDDAVPADAQQRLALLLSRLQAGSAVAS